MFENAQTRLSDRINIERAALANEKRRMTETSDVAPELFRTAHDLAHIHRYALKQLLAVRDGDIHDIGDDLTCPCCTGSLP